MIFEEALKILITTSPGFAALAGTRLYPNVIPQDAVLPAAAFQQVGAEPGHTHDGPIDLLTVHIQFTLNSKTSRETKALAKALRGILDGYQGTVAGIQFTSIFWENEIDGYAENSLVTTVRQDYKIRYKE